IDIGEHDDLSHEVDEQIVDGMNIQYKEANEVTVTIDGVAEEHYTTALTVGKFLTEADIEVTEHDFISEHKRTLINGNLDIEIETAFPVVIKVGDKKKKVWSTEQTVESILEKNNIKFNEKKDKVKPKLDKVLS